MVRADIHTGWDHVEAILSDPDRTDVMVISHMRVLLLLLYGADSSLV